MAAAHENIWHNSDVSSGSSAARNIKKRQQQSV